jgi:hypothetical protein
MIKEFGRMSENHPWSSSNIFKFKHWSTVTWYNDTMYIWKYVFILWKMKAGKIIEDIIFYHRSKLWSNVLDSLHCAWYISYTLHSGNLIFSYLQVNGSHYTDYVLTGWHIKLLSEEFQVWSEPMLQDMKQTQEISL